MAGGAAPHANPRACQDSKKLAMNIPDYTRAASWLFEERDTAKSFDIFYLYPTFYQGPAGALMDISAPRLAPYIKINVLKNCGIFSGLGNIYAPLYRQASFASINLPEAQKKELLIPTLADVSAAFEYYLQNNKGRPFVLAGHSQGSRLLRELMKAKFSNPALNSRLIAAYLIGAEITKQDLKDFPWLKLAARADDTGVIITYNTQAAGAKGSPVYERGGAVCVNPLNWADTPADKSLNLGAVFFDKSGAISAEIPQFTAAYIDAAGALIAPDADIDKYSLPIFPKGVYHIYDYEFFYRNLQQNFLTRLNSRARAI